MTFCKSDWNNKQRLLHQLTLTGQLLVSVLLSLTLEVWKCILLIITRCSSAFSRGASSLLPCNLKSNNIYIWPVFLMSLKWCTCFWKQIQKTNVAYRYFEERELKAQKRNIIFLLLTFMLYNFFRLDLARNSILVMFVQGITRWTSGSVKTGLLAVFFETLFI